MVNLRATEHEQSSPSSSEYSDDATEPLSALPPLCISLPPSAIGGLPLLRHLVQSQNTTH